jgi:hypothetical protein
MYRINLRFQQHFPIVRIEKRSTEYIRGNSYRMKFHFRLSHTLWLIEWRVANDLWKGPKMNLWPNSSFLSLAFCYGSFWFNCRWNWSKRKSLKIDLWILFCGRFFRTLWSETVKICSQTLLIIDSFLGEMKQSSLYLDLLSVYCASYDKVERPRRQRNQSLDFFGETAVTKVVFDCYQSSLTEKTDSKHSRIKWKIANSR